MSVKDCRLIKKTFFDGHRLSVRDIESRLSVTEFGIGLYVTEIHCLKKNTIMLPYDCRNFEAKPGNLAIPDTRPLCKLCNTKGRLLEVCCLWPGLTCNSQSSL